MKPFGIEYCEEPVNRPTAEKIQHIKKAAAARLALDESLYQVDDTKEWVRNSGADTLILKPMILGSFDHIRELCSLADSLNVKIVFTSALETGIGRMMTATFAAACGSKEHVHGLATGSLLQKDLTKDSFFIGNGSFYLPDQPGLGIALDPRKTEIELKPLEI
ncbi:MAG: enolase C-terminal domain-like protein [Balneolaceae bacterium]|nr:enolase C-terminal domain-like protein [Balneolaceae bacterium]